MIGKNVIVKIPGYSPVETDCMYPDQLDVEPYLYKKNQELCHKRSKLLSY